MIIFIHVPKTAGTSLRLIAEEHYGKGRILSVYGDAIPRAKQYVREQNLTNIAMIRGHIGFGVHEAVSEPCEYTTILRHPLERLVSLYLYIRKDRMHFAHENVRNMTFKQFVFSGVTAETDNGQIRQLLGVEEFKQTPYAKYNIGFGEIKKHDFSLVSSRLEADFSVVGVQEHFGTYLHDMRDFYGWSLPRQTPRVNTTKSAELVGRLDAQTVKDVLTFNTYDLALWNYAIERLGVA